MLAGYLKNNWYIGSLAEKSSRYLTFSFARDVKLIHVNSLNSVQHEARCQYDLLLSGRSEQSGSRCVIQRKGVKNIMSIRSPCGLGGTKGEEGCVFEVTHGFSQRRQINISLAFSSLQANSWDWPRFWSSVFPFLAHPCCSLYVICVWSQTARLIRAKGETCDLGIAMLQLPPGAI